MDFSADLLDSIVKDIDGQSAQKTAGSIIKLFDEAGLTIKVKHLFYTEPCAYYRVLCFIQKSKETLIINTKQDDGHKNIVGGMCIQLRIENKDTLNKLDDLSENIRKQILNGNNCRYCSKKCEGKRYIFTYENKKYVKCQMLCSNFRMEVKDENDMKSILLIVENEMERRKKI